MKFFRSDFNSEAFYIELFSIFKCRQTAYGFSS